MKWLALVLVGANLLLWYFAGALQPPARSSEILSGTLPRVASLRSPAGPEPVPESSEADLDGEPGEAVSSGPQPASPEPAPVGFPLQCVRMGWLESREAVQAIIDAVPAFEGIAVSIEEVERGRPPLNWVMIPPQPPEAARRQFRDIQRQGIDSYLVTQGEYRNAISLGLFESREAAISVLEETKRQNLNAILASYDRNQISYALDFEAEPDLAEHLVQAVTSEYGKNFDFIEINPCEGVATPEKTP